ncbi:MAG: hypothetical protein JAY99_12130 [Candidatus Thiodiazotropha lotti]|uniref:Uncharacterized protein n=1 Tax=Candidatus Thiodiazotropha endoloripes TaxID=1818881 RepID=A0A1E2UPZ7_9GAMM|nr:hypothetical protein [Candidatus Thiodiazotropha endoloripes]MCG7897974.1 hypothetical protein [Candidatus Thiodiazotropha weberae]MCG8000270.1 hypothetical protein [Candidatus Thiodiazotropha lotti]MCW4192040.1 hypothetical protein [Candidatus Thiodiazotropha weberae]ODB85335.1 hypothetical protein A3195_17205 [Candidatus Thiodiazotropha endoloripes]ODB96836.1 hypothetical protein A3196_08740 [Candidatus Thiodiazotropha endoloripes]
MMTKHNLYRLLTLFALLLIISDAFAIELRHRFTLTGSGGETGSGYFTWDDTVVADGNPLPLGNLVSGSVTITGGATPGGSQTFLLADWTNVIFINTPNFAGDLNIAGNNGVATLTTLVPYTALASDGGAWTTTLTFTPGTTIMASPIAVPLLDLPTLIFIVLVIAITGLWQINRSRTVN